MNFSLKIRDTVIIPPIKDCIPYAMIRRGDWNGFAQLFFDNVGTMLALIAGLNSVLTGFSNSTLTYYMENASELDPFSDTVNDIIYRRIIAGFGFSTFCGNIFYALQCIRTSTLKGYQATAIPYGINTPGSYAVLYTIISGTVSRESASCIELISDTTSNPSSALLTEYATCWSNAADAGWRAGVVTNFCVGIICFFLSFGAPWIMKISPPPALLTSLSGVAMAYLGLAQAANSYIEPIAGLLPLFLIFFLYWGDVDVPYLPKAAVVVITGMVLGWADGVLTSADPREAADLVQWYGMSASFYALGDWSTVGTYIGAVFPVAIAAAAGTLMNNFSAKVAGDEYNVMVTMAADGCGTIIGSFFGCPFSTCVYIGHPAYKLMGAGSFYSSFTGVIIMFLSFSGLFAMIEAIIPLQGVAPIIFFVGMMICAEAVAATPPRQMPVVFFGLFFSICDWCLSNGFSYDDTENYFGFVAMANGTLLNALVSCSLACFIIDRNYISAGIWAVFAAFLSAFGIIHQTGGTVKNWAEPQGDSSSNGYCIIDESTNSGVCSTDRTVACAAGGDDYCGWMPTLKWRFMVAYIMIACICALFHVLQRFGFIKPTIADEEDAEELAEAGGKELMRMSSIESDPQYPTSVQPKRVTEDDL